jgi:Asp-tRNA(Asn)/Glu-tRNA(Gln) amidotransferase A subunit family amidase
MKHYEYLKARETLETNVLKVMADNALDAIVHKTVEHQPTLISEGFGPPYYNMRGAPHLNTFLVYAASMSVPAGFTTDDLPFGITLFGRAYSEPTLLKLAYAYEQATMHRRPPAGMPPLAGEPWATTLSTKTGSGRRP